MRMKYGFPHGSSQVFFLLPAEVQDEDGSYSGFGSRNLILRLFRLGVTPVLPGSLSSAMTLQ